MIIQKLTDQKKGDVFMNRKMLKTIITMMLCFIMAFCTPLTIFADTSDETEIVQTDEEGSSEETQEVVEPVSEPDVEPASDNLPDPEIRPATEPAAEPEAEPVSDVIPTGTAPAPTGTAPAAPAAEPVSDVTPTGTASDPAGTAPAAPAAEPVSAVIPTGTASAPTETAPAAPAAEPVSNVTPTGAASSPAGTAPVEPKPGEAGYKIIDASITDAEKYMEDGYDANLCWAGTAANMLWTTNYGREAVNPQTNENFKNEDELFDYFRKNFTDKAGDPSHGITYFIEGVYPSNNVDGVSHLKPNAAKGGLIPGFVEIPQGHLIMYDENQGDDVLFSLDSFVGKAVGGFIQWWNTDTNRFDPGAHWLTVVGLEKNADGFYNGIWVVDSDNDPVLNLGEVGPPDATDKDKADLAANAPNSRTYYPVARELIDQMYYWVIEGYSSPNVKSVLSCLCVLLNMPLNGGGDPEEEPDENEKKDDSRDDTNKSENETSNDKIAEYQRANPEISYEEAVLMAEFNLIQEQMIKNGTVYYCPTGNTYDKNSSAGYSFVINRMPTSLLNVYVNGVRLSGNGQYYTITRTPNGMFVITFNNEYLQSLDAGEYSIRMEFDGLNDVDTTVIVK